MQVSKMDRWRIAVFGQTPRVEVADAVLAGMINGSVLTAYYGVPLGFESKFLVIGNKMVCIRIELRYSSGRAEPDLTGRVFQNIPDVMVGDGRDLLMPMFDFRHWFALFCFGQKKEPLI